MTSRRGPLRAALAAAGSALGALGRGAAVAHREVTVRGRWVVVAVWAAVVYVVLAAGGGGSIAQGGAGGFGSDLLPQDSDAVRIQQRVLAEFDVPVAGGTTVVVRDEDGLDLGTRRAIVEAAYETSRPVLDGNVPPPGEALVAAVPVPVLDEDVAVTYLFFTPDSTLSYIRRTAEAFGAAFEGPGTQSWVTGFAPAQIAQADYLQERLTLFEVTSVLVIGLVVGLVFRSILAPFVVLAVGGAGFLVYNWALVRVAEQTGLGVPAQLEPVLAALFIGVVTDYCVLFFSSFRTALRSGAGRVQAARESVRLDGPVITVAGLTVAGGTLALLASSFEFFRALGPALALTVIAGAAVSLTLAPALMAILGTRLFRLRGGRLWPVAGGGRTGERLAGVLTNRVVAVAAVGLSGALLVWAALPVTQARLSLSFTESLPAADPVAAGAAVLQDAGIRGVTAPTEVLVTAPGVTDRRAELDRLQDLLADQPGVALIIGPSENPLRGDYGVVLSRSGNAARYIVVLDSDPLGAAAVSQVRDLQEQIPRLAAAAGLTDADIDVTGQSRVAAEVVDLTAVSLRDTLLVAVLVELLILVLYLRSLLAPVAVLLAGLVSMGAALGLTVLVFQDVLGQPGLTFYAPFATAVLLLALGSDYTVFTVGAIWERARDRSLRAAITAALPTTAVAVTTAGLILATTFALVAIIPLTTFRQIAFTMAVGLLIDTFVTRPLLVPAMLALLGRAARWPGGPSRAAPPPEPVPAAAAQPGV